ncbi:PhzF family phenazine biosynthesis protein [Evansella halocellulosilytica]|uniref:PhzF family phenazine biosynthesis protein n=1 Tax=Evansella halocellulosilytica TaxID=2011013 RepID=UPI000BB95554|nr:PhzF family phenazine biosynthesis protein [Evansella halocellulosilytica]
MTKYSYSLVDVFTDRLFGGNQLAVLPNAEGLSDQLMQKIAAELNLSETAFVFQATNPENHNRVRFFTPQTELPMAGHPTIGTAYVLTSNAIIKTKQGANQLVFEEGVGNIIVTVHNENNEIKHIEMNQPLPKFGDYFSRIDSAAELLSLNQTDIDTRFPIQSVSTGVPFLFIPVKSTRTMKDINFNSEIWKKMFRHNEYTKHIFVFSTDKANEESIVRSRMFAPAMGIAEDPATGAASGPLGAYLVEHGIVTTQQNGNYKIRSEQGVEMGRPSFIDITVVKQEDHYKEIKIGGTVVEVGNGSLSIP